MTTTPQQLPAIATAPDALATRMFELTCGFVITRLLHAVATLQIADLLTAGPRRIDDLAGEAGVDADALSRILRALAALDVFTEVAPDTFAITPLGSKLRTDSPNSMHDMALMCGEEGLYTGVGHLTPAMRKGTVSFHEAHGKTWWEYMKEWAHEERIFNGAMGNLTGEIHAAALAAYDLTGARRLVDVGGGHGYLVADMLQRYPEARATVFDQPHVALGAHATLDAAGVLDRAEVIGGDFLEAVPSGGDVYVVSMTLHNWPDADAIRILTNIRRAMAPGGRVLIIEPVIPEGDTYHFGKILDIVMMAVFGSRERTVAQHAALFQAAGLRYTRTIETGRLTSVVEAMV